MATSSSTGTSSNPQQQQQSASDDYILPYLVVGTEVSAKFKGAFCEAKIKKCDLALKCKLTLKTTSGGSPSITVSYDQLRTATGGPITYNDLRPGSTVYVTKETAAAESSDKSISKAAAGELQQATLNKVIDQSEYSVVFNDGDEMTLKRSRIRYKGEKHFLDSETLNHAPLNNPEHFLFPIKNKSEAAAAASESESESVATTSSNKANSRSLSRSGKQQQQPTTTRVKREKEAPAEEAAGDDAESSGSSDVDSDSSDDYPPEEKDRFVAQLYKFMDDRGTPMNKVPAVNKVDLDLHKFFIVVKKNGGFNKVCKQRKWSEVYKKLNLPDINSANVSNLKSAYERYLHPYEDFYRKLGSTMCDLGSHRPSTSASASKRSLASELHQRAPASTSHLFKPRYLSQTQSSAQKIKQTTSTPTAASKSADRLTSTSSTTSTPPGAGGVGSASSTTPESQPAPATNKPATASSCDVSSMEDQLTIESLAKSLTTDIQTPGASAPTTAPAAAAAANSMLLSTSIASSDDADKTMSLAGGLPEDTLTLSGIARNISEDFKKSKKEAAAATTSSSFSSAATTTGSTTTPATALTPSGASAKRGRRGRRTSSESGLKILGSRPKSVKNEPRDDDADNDLDADNDDDDEETSKINDDTTDDEPKPKKKYARASSDLDTSSSTSKSTSNSSAFKRKSTIKSEQQTESDSQESMSHSFKLNQFTADDLEVNQLIEVKYGHGKTTYQAKIVKIEREDNTVWVHYLGWNNRYDEWIEISKIIRIFNENCSNKRRKPSKVGSAPVIATTVRRGASANDADSNGKSSTKKKTPSTSSASSSSSGDNKIDKPPPGSKRVSSQSSLDRQTSNEDATVATAASHPDNLLSIKEEILDYQSASGADNANDSEAHENVFEEPVVAKSSTATASAAANKEESEPEEIAAPVSSAISSSSSSPPDSNRVASIQPPDFSLEEFSTKPAAIISSTSGSMLPPATVTSQDPTQTLNNSSSSQIEVDVKKELATTPTVSISPLPPPPPPPAPSPATAATPAPSTPPGPSRRRTSTRVSSTNTVSSNNNTPLPVVESISDDNVSDANKTNVKSESELVTPIPPPPPVVVPSVPPTTGFSDEDFKENKKDKQNKSNTTETSLNNSNNNAQSNNQETNSQSNGVLKTHGSATFNTIQNEPLVFSKYPFHLNGCTFTGKARIRFIEEQMRLCREEYMKLKNEISAIDRKRKLKRSQHDKTNNDGESNSAANSSILNASTSQKK